MTRRSAVQLLGSAPAWAQKPRGAPQAAPAPQKIVVDVAVSDPQGNLVRTLRPSDFSVQAGGRPQAVTAFAAVDVLTGASRSAAPLPLPMKIDPGELHRNFVFVVDDAGIAMPHIKGLRDALLHFVNEQIGERDTFALIRTSGGTAPYERVFDEKRAMRAAIQRLPLNPAASLPSAPPWPQTLHYALEGLRAVAGRKAVVLAWERMPESPSFDSVIALANRAWASVYTIYGGENPAPQNLVMAELAASTGGFNFALALPAALERIAKDQESYYLLGFESGLQSAWQDAPLSVKLARPGMDVRSRLQPPVTAPPVPPADSGSPQAELRRKLVSPMESGSMRVRILPRFGRSNTSWIDATMLVDVHDVTFTHKTNGMHYGGLDFVVRVYDLSGEIVCEQSQTASLPLPTAAYEEMLKRGMSIAIRAPVPKPGVFQMHAGVRDSTSGNTGTAHSLIEVPDVSRGDLTISGITLLPEDAAVTAEQDSPLDSARYVFPSSRPFTYTCSVFNVAVDEDKRARIEVSLSIYSDGRPVYQRSPIPLTVAGAANQRWLTVRGKLEMSATTVAGDFVLQLTVADKVKPRTASQWTEFTLLP